MEEGDESVSVGSSNWSTAVSFVWVRANHTSNLVRVHLKWPITALHLSNFFLLFSKEWRPL